MAAQKKKFTLTLQDDQSSWSNCSALWLGERLNAQTTRKGHVLEITEINRPIDKSVIRKALGENEFAESVTIEQIPLT